MIGKTTHEQIWNQLCKNISKEVSIKYLFESYTNTPLNQKMIDLIKRLKKTNKTGLVTDNKKDRMDAAKKEFAFSDLFDVIMVSAEVGSKKTKEEIFRKTVSELCVKYDECVFIDNQESNLVVPKKIGMNTVFFNHKDNDIKKLVKELKLLGVTL